ncbi:MAG: adenylosuccinate lyase [Actinobacteria bacterium]|nr:adenylosuccinate lyase [Actinomycetota bacterium]
MSVLSNRYASKEMREIWSPESKIKAERRLWIDVMRFQAEALNIPTEAIAKYEAALEKIDLASIDEREKKSRHDVKARIDEFNALAGHEYIHLGMTSRDLTENIEAAQILSALKLIQERTASLLFRIGEKAEIYKALPIVGRSHNVPAQLTTLGKKFATIAEELLFAFDRLNNLVERYPLRGFKGPVGTSQDMRDLLRSSGEIEREIAKSLGFNRILDSTGQVYPRSFDFDVVSALAQLAAAPANLATSIRLMAGLELVSEGFAPNQVGSSAMPHKMNSRSCERINGLAVVLRGYLSMISEVSGEQWNEGDISDSVVRRVAISDAFFALDAILETTLTVLNEFGIFEANIRREIEEQLPFLATTKILMAAVKAGAGRESAHEALKELSTKALIAKREGKAQSLLDAIAADSRIPLDKSVLEELVGNPIEFIGDATSQTERVVARIGAAIKPFPGALTYRPGAIR